MFSANKQLKLNLNLDLFIPEDSDVKLLRSVFQNIHINIPQNVMGGRTLLPSEVMLEILVYGYMNKKISSRSIPSKFSKIRSF